MDTREITDAVTTLFDELVDGTPSGGGYTLNRDDPGLLRSLDRLSAAEASAAAPGGGASVAAHVEHLRYGFSLLNRWSDGEENPFATADWTDAWRHGNVTDDEWARRRAALREQAERWRRALATPREVEPVELNGMIGSVAHLAYHVGAIRQIASAARGPSAEE